MGSILFAVIFFLFLIDGILIYSMMLSDVEERTYEFAMLRTLGFKNSSLVTLLLGLVTGIVVPMISKVYPIKQALGTSLRDALDRFR